MHGRWWLLCLFVAIPATALADEDPSAPTSTEILLASSEERGAAVSGGPAIPPPKPEERDENRAPQYRAWGYFNRPINGQPARLGFVKQEFSTPIPLWICDTDILAASVLVRNFHFQSGAQLPEIGSRFPKDLWDIRLGLNYFHTFDNGWKFGLMPRLGSPSDKPFASIREMNLGATSFLRMPAERDGDFWTVSLSYFPNSQLAFPLPGGTYEWNPSDRLKIGLGLPFSFTWKPTDEVRFDFNYTPLTLVTARASWNPKPVWKLYTGFDWDNEGYFLAGRADRRDLFFFYEKRLCVGTRIDLGERCAVDFSGGYAFDREFGSGRSPINFTSNQVKIESGAFISGWLLAFF